MIEGLIGKKIGMTHLFAGEARVIPVTVLEVGPCVVTQVRTESRDGYEAVQIGYGAAKQLSKPAAGHLAASGARVRTLREFEADDVSAYRVGQELRVSQFQADDLVDVVSTTKGRGFQGAMRRHGFGGGQKTHGQGDRGRAVGSIGAGTYPGRVLKGKKMPGHMGNKRKTIRKLKVVSVDTQRNLLFVRGAVPGSRNTTVMVRYAHGVPVAERTIPEEPVVEIEETVAEVEGTVTEAAEAAQEGQAADAPQDEPETAGSARRRGEEPAAEAEAASSDETSQEQRRKNPRQRPRQHHQTRHRRMRPPQRRKNPRQRPHRRDIAGCARCRGGRTRGRRACGSRGAGSVFRRTCRRGRSRGRRFTGGGIRRGRGGAGGRRGGAFLMQLPQYDMNASAVDSVEVSDVVFGAPENQELLHQTLVYHRANQRSGTSNTLTRGQVSGTGRKPFAQKGTGRARQGSWKSPHHRGGGVAFGPSPRSYRKRMPKQMRRQAIRTALSGKVAEERLFVVDGLDAMEQKTKAAADLLAAFGVTGSALVVVGTDSQAGMAVRNIPRVKAIRADVVNVLDLLRYDAVLMSADAVRRVDEIWADTRRVRPQEAVA